MRKGIKFMDDFLTQAQIDDFAWKYEEEIEMLLSSNRSVTRPFQGRDAGSSPAGSTTEELSLSSNPF